MVIWCASISLPASREKDLKNLINLRRAKCEKVHRINCSLNKSPACCGHPSFIMRVTSPYKSHLVLMQYHSSSSSITFTSLQLFWYISKMADFTGKWCIASSENFDAYLDALGGSYGIVSYMFCMRNIWNIKNIFRPSMAIAMQTKMLVSTGRLIFFKVCGLVTRQGTVFV